MLYALSYKRLFILEKEILEVERVMVRDRETDNQQPSTVNSKDGGLAQLARAPALHAGGHRFDSDILHISVEEKSSLTYWDKKIQKVERTQ